MGTILILAPHPDDEILGCAGVIKRAIGVHEVWVVLATNGDYYGRESAAIRLMESRVALQRLGVPNSHVIALGFGDTGMTEEDSFLNRLYHAGDHTLCRSFVSDCSYHPLAGCAEHFQSVPYTKVNFLLCLRQVLLRCQPDVIYTSSQYDMHGDHRALYLFLRKAFLGTQLNPILRQYITHGGNDKAWPPRDTAFFPKPPRCPQERWERRFIVGDVDAVWKRKLIQMFQSQISPSGYLLSFAKAEEVFL